MAKIVRVVKDDSTQYAAVITGSSLHRFEDYHGQKTIATWGFLGAMPNSPGFAKLRMDLFENDCGYVYDLEENSPLRPTLEKLARIVVSPSTRLIVASLGSPRARLNHPHPDTGAYLAGTVKEVRDVRDPENDDDIRKYLNYFI